MRALVCKELGPIESLQLGELADPAPKKGQVVVDVRAAGVNFPDLLLVQGLYQMRPPLPFSPGSELSGVISSVGEGVTELAVGDRVMAYSGFGAFAERIALSTAQCVRIPDSMSFDAAAGFLLTYCTSHHALIDRGRLAAGDRVLVLGASGGVGIAAVQIAKARGASVIAVASSEEKRAFCIEQGADEVVAPSGDFKAKVKALGGVDVVYDAVGGDLAEPALRGLKPRGRFLVVGFASGTIPKLPLNLALLKEIDVVGVQWGVFAMREPDSQRAMVEDLLAMWGEGQIRPVIHAAYPLEQGVEALAEIRNRTVRGKIVIHCGPGA